MNERKKSASAKECAWTEEDNRELRRELELMAEPKFQAFTSRLMPGVEHILGVRLPLLRKQAKRIAKGDWRGYLGLARDNSYEEIMLQGMVLGYAKGTLADKAAFLHRFIPKIDNWSVCDSFCTGLKIARDEPEAMWEFLKPYLSSEREYEIRFGIVMLLNYYIRPEYLGQSFLAFSQIRHEGYYVRMALAWALSMYYVAFPKETLAFLEQGGLDVWVLEKTYQKIIESRQIDEETRGEMARRKRKLQNRMK